VLLISSCMLFWSVSVVPRYLNFSTSSLSLCYASDYVTLTCT
jgi:hypothetical protein